MGVDVHPAGGDQMAGRVDVAPGRAGLAADRDDLVAVDGDVTGEGRTAGAVHNGTAADDNVMHRVNSPIGLEARMVDRAKRALRVVSTHSGR